MFKEKFGQLFNKIKNVGKPTNIKEDNGMVVLESNSLGFSVVEEKQVENKILTDGQWRQIVKNGSFDGFSHNQVYFSFLKGIPDQLRLQVWLMLSCPQSLLHGLEQKYLGFMNTELDTVSEHQINVDLKRTYGRMMGYTFTCPTLKRILYATHSYGHQYTQGMNYILLYVLIFCTESENPQDIGVNLVQAFEVGDGRKAKQVKYSSEFQSKVFAVFVGILDKMERIFGHNLSKFMDVMKELQVLLVETLPELMYSIAGMGFDVLSLMSQNYFSLMMYASPPLQMAKMILDLFQLEGHKAIHAILVRMLELCCKQLMQQKTPEDFQKVIKTGIFDICGERFIQEKITANCIEDFGLSFYQKTQFD